MPAPTIITLYLCAAAPEPADDAAVFLVAKLAFSLIAIRIIYSMEAPQQQQPVCARTIEHGNGIVTQFL